MFEYSFSYAQQQDQTDVLAKYRDAFLIPQHNGKNVIYLTGNSLGLQPKKVKQYMQEELDDWAKYGVEGHFEAKRPWYSYHELFTEKMAKIVGAKPLEIVMMNGLTTNIHLLMATFYRPTSKKYKILTETKAFPSDQYAIESQLNLHGYGKDGLIEIEPKDSKRPLQSEDEIIKLIERNANELALVFIGGVNYYTGQFFDIELIGKKCKEHGIVFGVDLAHAAGNVPLKLNEWDVDFAAWCTYKYLNAGPGAISGVYINEKHATNTSLPRMAGWWGYDKNKRFKMDAGFEPIPTAEGWQLSNAPVFSMTPLLASLDLFEEAGMTALRQKSEKLTAYLEYVLAEISKKHNTDFEVITPKEIDKRGCQLSVLCHHRGKELFDFLSLNGVVADWREPNVIRMAPVPLYNSFEDIFNFGKILENAINS